MMKKLFALAAFALALLVSCKEDNPDTPKPTGSIVGVWELSSVKTKVAIGDTQVSVYVEFTGSNNFVLYQKLGEGRYSKFDGAYAFAQDNKLSGSYTGGSSWGPYDVELSETTLTLATAGGKEVDTYKKISAIPESVLENLY